jgi:hypothetical protein
MRQKKDKPKPKKREPWNRFIYLADLAKALLRRLSKLRKASKL